MALSRVSKLSQRVWDGIKQKLSVLTRLSVCRPAVSLLKDLKHANIVTLHDIVHTDKSLTLVFEYLVRTTRPRLP